MTARQRLAAWRAREPLDRWLLIEAVAALAVARLALVLLPFRTVATWLDHQPAPRLYPDDLPARVGRATVTAARHVPWKAVCLPQALAARALLARRGVVSRVYFGVARDGGVLSAHAWLEVDGQTVVGGGQAKDRTVMIAQFG